MLIVGGKANPVLKMYGHLIIENLLRTGRTDFHFLKYFSAEFEFFVYFYHFRWIEISSFPDFIFFSDQNSIL